MMTTIGEEVTMMKKMNGKALTILKRKKNLAMTTNARLMSRMRKKMIHNSPLHRNNLLKLL